VRPPKLRRRPLPAARGGLTAAAAAVVLAAVLAAVTGGRAVAAAGGPPPAVISTATAPAGVAAATSAATPGGASGTGPAGGSLSGATPTHLVVPDLIATAAGGVTPADVAKVTELSGVRSVLAVDGARIQVNGKWLTVLAASAAQLRAWTPPATAASAAVWSAFQAGDLITTAGAATTAGLARGHAYPAAAAVDAQLTDGGTALLGVSGVDGIVSQAEGARLGLVSDVALLVNAPAADMIKLTGQVQAALGGGARVVRLVAVTESTKLPVDDTPSTGKPTGYLQLFKESAADYCPGLSWTVLAAIGQIESGDGQNEGPSSAGALGPMQFEPSTWALWGTDGFGDTGAPDIMNPYDAVPSAARMLCADGAARGTAGLRGAIFSYNHADWYVDEVLALAAEYAREYA
jgi:hypothetical protein